VTNKIRPFYRRVRKGRKVPQSKNCSNIQNLHHEALEEDKKGTTGRLKAYMREAQLLLHKNYGIKVFFTFFVAFVVKSFSGETI